MNTFMRQAVCNIINHNKRPAESWTARVGGSNSVEFFADHKPGNAEVVMDDHELIHFAHLIVDDSANRLTAESEARFTAALATPEPKERPQ